MDGSLEPSPLFDHLPEATINLVLILLLGGPLGKEFGWRSYGLTALWGRQR